MPNESLLRSLDFTKSIGRRLDDDIKFSDANDVGQFPNEQRILRIEKIEVYNDGHHPLAVIVGLAVTYLVATPGQPPQSIRVTHGLVGGEPCGTVTLNKNQILVGASGKLKHTMNFPYPDPNGRISFIAFDVYDNQVGYSTVYGPFGSQESVGPSWGSYGPIISFQGTKHPKYGLASLGFTRLIQGIPEMGITDN